MFFSNCMVLRTLRTGSAADAMDEAFDGTIGGGVLAAIRRSVTRISGT
ncbi:MAG: hypothetical protein IPG22_15360 [Acidobacteria bacterium]|nr:hypothetical protein [Acidobacteriota bacterium]